MRVHIIGFTKWIFVTTLAVGIVLYYTASSNLQFKELVHLLTFNDSYTQNDSHTSSRQAAISRDADGASSIIGICPSVQFPSHLMELEIKWQPIGTGKNMYAFSAYYIEDPSTVYVIGIKSRRDADVICQLWWLEGDVFVMGEESLAATPRWLDDSGLRYSPTIFECFVTSPGIPYYVSLSIKGCGDPLNLLKVEDVTPPERYDREITVCPDPISIKNTMDRDLIIWFETNRLFGAELFILYVVSTTPEVNAIIEFYVKRGLVQLVDWNLPMATEDRPENSQPKEIARYARVGAMNECLFRNKRHSQFVLNIDTNEFVLTRGKNIRSWSELIVQLDPSASSYCLDQGTFSKAKTGHAVTSSPLCKEYSKHFLRTADATFTLPNFAPGLNVQRVPTRLGVMHRQNKYIRRKRSNADEIDSAVLEEFQYRNILIKNVQYVRGAIHIEPANEHITDSGLMELA